MRQRAKRKGVSYMLRLSKVNAIYDRYAKTGLSNREIWRRFIYPEFGISERTLYHMLSAAGEIDEQAVFEHRQLTLFDNM
jgi:hypothetical protein